MTYITIKKRGRKGSFAYPFSTNLIGLVSDLQLKYHDKDIQIVGVSNFNVYSEYEPVTYVKHPEDLEEAIKGILQEESLT